MSLFSRRSFALLLPLLLAGCQGFDLGGSSEPKTLQPIHYLYTDIGIGFDREMVIAPSGEVLIRETRGSSAGGTRKIKSTILESERANLISAFRDWNKLDPFYPTDVSPQFEITYGGRSVTTSRLDGMPAGYLMVKGQLDRIIMVLDKAADEQTAAQAARAAANATQPATRTAAPPDALPVPVDR
jgi:hypothetical protein